MEVPLVISNHRDLESTCENLGIDFKYIPNDAYIKIEAEERMLLKEIVNNEAIHEEYEIEDHDDSDMKKVREVIKEL